MTNNPTIDGVSRSLLETIKFWLERAQESTYDSDIDGLTELRALLDAPVNPLREHCKQCAEVVKTWPEWKQNCLGGVPAVERQEPICDHEWTDDGAFLLVCTKCGTQENHDPKWRDMGSAPRDGTLLRLLVSFDEHSTEDADEAPTIGANNLDNNGEDVWLFAGWCWSHDHFTQGKGSPIGWLPMIDCAEPEVAALQSTIAQLEEKLNKAIDLDFQRRETIAKMEARVQELESGRGDSTIDRVAALVDGKTVSVDVSTGDHDAGNRLFCQIVEVMKDGDSYVLLAVDPVANFEAAPPAPVAVVDENAAFENWAAWHYGIDESEELNLSNPDVKANKIGWLARACLDATAALNGVKS